MNKGAKYSAVSFLAIGVSWIFIRSSLDDGVDSDNKFTDAKEVQASREDSSYSSMSENWHGLEETESNADLIAKLQDDLNVELPLISGKDKIAYLEKFIREKMGELSLHEALEVIEAINNATLYDAALLAVLRNCEDESKLAWFISSQPAIGNEAALQQAGDSYALVSNIGGLEIPGFLLSRPAALKGFFQRTALRNPNLVGNYADLLSNSEERREAYQNAISKAVDYESVPKQTIAGWIEALGPDADQVGNGLMLGSRWIQEDQGEALEWFDKIQESNENLAASVGAGIVTGWFDFDSLSCSEWVAQLPPGKVRTACVVKLAGRLLDQSPEDAQKWLESLSSAAE